MTADGKRAEKAPKSESKDDAKILNDPIEQEMQKSYLDYAMSVIVGRALPDVRDGLKPVHRRILYAMADLGMRHSSPYKKSARIVGEVLGKYHPHGDQSVYDALVRMAQEFSLRYPLVDGQGNFGSIDGDSPAAMRYTEARLAKIADEILEDIEKETVEFGPNFDGSLEEPLVLPSKLPNMLVNGATGIAVGMATSIPPHNLTEVADATIHLIDHPECAIADLFDRIKGPDFPTGGIIAGRSGITHAYATGRGRILLKSVITEETKGGKERFVVTEIPYMVNKAELVEEIADRVKEKVIEGISDLRDESDREGMRIVIELKKDASADIVLNGLLKHTRLQMTFSIIMLGLVKNQPKVLTLKEMLEEHIHHRQSVVRKRTAYDLKKARERAHILEGLKIALERIDPIVKLIKEAKTPQIAREQLSASYSLSEIQATAILDMKLQKITGLEREKLLEELRDLQRQIVEYERILADEREILKIIKQELVVLREKFGDVRKTRIDAAETEEIDVEDLIEPEDVVVTISKENYCKRVPVATYRAQGRGGRGITAATTKEEDFIEHLFIANTHDWLLVFTDKGKIYWTKVYKMPEGSRQSKGKPIINIVKTAPGEKVRAVIPVKEFSNDKYLLFATKQGLLKKTVLSAYENVREGGIIATNLEDDDDLVTVLLTSGHDTIFLASAHGMAIRCSEEDVRATGRNSTGVIGIRLEEKDEVVDAIISHEDETILTITENGYGKRTAPEEYRHISRGGKGVINIITSERNGEVVAVRSVRGDADLMLISKSGITIRTPVTGVSVIGRNTQGVRLMKLADGDAVNACAIVEHENGAESAMEQRTE